jgi:AraC-like DNA-binding protein
MKSGLQYQVIKPHSSIQDYVDSFWMLKNFSNKPKEVMVLPDGNIDLCCEESAEKPFHITLAGLQTQPEAAIIAPGTTMFSISFNLLAVEYLLNHPVANIINSVVYTPHPFLDVSQVNFNHFEDFYNQATQQIKALIPTDIDSRKQALFTILNSPLQEQNVQTIAKAVFWSSRQIHRYFHQQFGVSLKTYLSILRFRASFPDIQSGKLYPQQKYSDQSHFIKAVKQLAGVVPKTLQRNQNDRFIQFSMLPPS